MKKILFLLLTVTLTTAIQGGILDPWWRKDSNLYLLWNSDKTIAFKAVRRNDWPTFYRMIVEKKIDVDGVNDYGHSLLFLAVRNRRSEMIKFLLARNAKPNASMRKNTHVPTPLIKAVEEGRTDITEILLKAGADPNQSVYINRTALTEAVSRDDLALVDCLLQNGADPNQPDACGPPLHYASRGASPEIIKLLLRYGAKVNALDRNGRTALSEAVACGEYPNSAIAKTKLLLAAGAKVNLCGEKCSLERTFPLYLAAQSGNTEVAELLIERGADVNKEIPLLFFSSICLKKNSNGKFVQYRPAVTPLSVAVKSKSLPMIWLLLEHGAKTNRKLAEDIKKLEAVDEPLETDLFAILSGSSRGQFEKVRKAIAAGADLNALNCYNETILEKVSSRAGNIDLVSLLLKHNAKRKDSALCKAIAAGNVETVKLLLKNGADPNAISFQHLFPRPVFFLSNRNATKILPLLLKAGAKINYKNDQGQNVLGVLNCQSKNDAALWVALIKAGANWQNINKAGKNILEQIIADDLQERRSGLVRLFLDYGANPETVRDLAQKYERKNLLFLLDKVWGER